MYSEIIKADITSTHILLYDSSNSIHLYSTDSLDIIETLQVPKQKEIHDISLSRINPTQTLSETIAVVSYWNESKVDLFLLPNLKTPMY
jgi:hypothetical protein